jgi:hypothetical protein
MYTKISKIYEMPTEIKIDKVKIPTPFWYIFFPVCILYPVITNFIMPYYFGAKYYSLGAVLLSCCLVLLIPALYFKWNYFSDFPTRIHIFRGCITIEFHRLFGENRIIEVKPQNRPTLVGESYLHYPLRICYSRIRLETTNHRTIVLYLKTSSSEQEALYHARQLAKKMADISGFFIRN